jgi:soluble lytic murein transglycosylase-like protein
MIDAINNIYKRISEIQNTGKNLGEELKPEKVREFENSLKEALSKNSTENSSSSSVSAFSSSEKNDIHPYLQNSENKILNSYLDPEKKALISNAVKTASKKYNLSEDLINAVIKVESNYDQFSISNKGAMGLMQLIPQTAYDMGVNEPFDIDSNIDGGTHYLRLMLDKYKGNIDKALAAYNAGPQRVDEAGGVPEIPETIDYVKKIKNILYK